MRWIALLLGFAFMTALGLMVGLRLPDESLVVVLGVVAGIGASIPTSVLVAWIAVRSFHGQILNEEAPFAEPVPQRKPRKPRRRPQPTTEYVVQDDDGRDYTPRDYGREYTPRELQYTPDPTQAVVMNAPPRPRASAPPSKLPGKLPPYAATGYPAYPPSYAPLPPRRFTVIGGAETADDE